MRSYAIGDIHGHLDLLERAHERIAADMAVHGPAPVIHLGDLEDRGPDSRGVIEFLMAGEAAGQDWVVLKGNHDRMFALYLTDLKAHDPGLRPDLSWLHPRLGGASTLEVWPGMVHVFQALPHLAPEAGPALRRAAAFIADAYKRSNELEEVC